MSALVLSVERFFGRFPEFRLVRWLDKESVENVLERTHCWLIIRGSECDEPYYLLAAHLLELSRMAAKGESQFGVIQSASVDGVSVSVQTPPVKAGWQGWLSSTPYGQMLWAWLGLHAVGGWEVGGLPERSAYRKVAGVFW